jgi:hypothetical protein
LIFPNSKLKAKDKFKPVLFSSFCFFVEDDEDTVMVEDACSGGRCLRRWKMLATAEDEDDADENAVVMTLISNLRW